MTDSSKKTHKDPLIEALEKAKKTSSGEEVEKFKKELTEANKKLSETEEKLTQVIELGRRAVADMENMKRRAEEDKSRMALFANIDLIKKLIPILNNFERADKFFLQKRKNENTVDTKGFESFFGHLQGLDRIIDDFKETLEQEGLKEINPLNETFDPHFHEAVMQDKGPKDKILEVFEPGYMLGTYVIRPAKVKVGQG